MAMQMIVGPAMPAADGWAPERPAPYAADHAACDRANRPRDEEAGSRTGTGADPIRAGRRHGGDPNGRKYGRCQ